MLKNNKIIKKYNVIVLNNLYFILQGDVNSAWKHDMFDGVKKVGRGAIGNAGTTKLLVSNLDFGVSDSDIQVLKSFVQKYIMCFIY